MYIYEFEPVVYFKRLLFFLSLLTGGRATPAYGRHAPPRSAPPIGAQPPRGGDAQRDGAGRRAGRRAGARNAQKGESKGHAGISDTVYIYIEREKDIDVCVCV